jgi:energy-coupling factor transporter transmembrane protein EcfT
MILGYRHGNSLLHRYDPRLKLIMLLAAVMAVNKAAGAELAFQGFVLSSMLLVFLSPQRDSFRQIVSAIRFVLVLLVFSLAAGGISASAGLLPLSARLYTWVILGFLYTGTTSSSEIRATFFQFTCWIPGFPASYFALMISITLSSLPRFNTALKTGTEALVSRGGVPWYRPIRRLRAVSIPLLLRTVKQASQISDALAARGFNGNRVFRVGKLPLKQIAFTAAFIAAYPWLAEFFACTFNRFSGILLLR